MTKPRLVFFCSSCKREDRRDSMPFLAHLLEIVTFNQPLKIECRAKMLDLLSTNPKGLRDQICAKIIHIKLFQYKNLRMFCNKP